MGRYSAAVVHRQTFSAAAVAAAPSAALPRFESAESFIRHQPQPVSRCSVTATHPPPQKKKSLNCARVRELQTKQSVGFHRRGAFKVGLGLSQVGLCSTSAKDKQETDDESEVLSSRPKSIPIDKLKNGQQGFFLKCKAATKAVGFYLSSATLDLK